ncbi:chaplin [Streptomyces sp. NPDC051105]|uniref:chaplin n=1 Tax=Streptomyces sp. NPDC051105 TaxID=3154843 RepID=UPI0034131AA6
MRQTLSRGMVVAAAAAGMLSLYASPALADTDATGTAGGSPGVVSGNNVQAPVNVPVNLCGNSVDVAAALNPAFGGSCANASDSGEHSDDRASETSYGDSGADTSGYGSTGCDSGYGAEGSPGNTPSPYGDETSPPYGDETSPPCGETTPPPSPTPPPRPTPSSSQTPSSPSPTPPPSRTPSSPSPTPPPPSPTPPPGGGHHQGSVPTLPHTGSDRGATLAASAASAALIAAGTMLYRRGRAGSRRS